MVFEARTLEPAQGMLVGVYSNPSDTAITTLPMERIAKTNQLGQFTIRGLKPGDYRIFAITLLSRRHNHFRHYILDLNVFVEVYGYFVGFNTLRAYCRIALHVVGTINLSESIFEIFQ